MTIEQLNNIESDIENYKNRIKYLKIFHQKISSIGKDVRIVLGESFNEKHCTTIPSYHAAYFLSRDIGIYEEKLKLAESQLIAAAVSYSESLKNNKPIP
jgi:hypothetical protein